MDEFIRKLLFKLSETYQPSILTVTFFDEKRKGYAMLFILYWQQKEKKKFIRRNVTVKEN